MLNGKCVILGVTGSIAAYKTASLASMLVKQKCEVHVIMTKNAAQFITPVTFETLTGNKCLIDTFDRNFDFEVEHISLAKKADLVMVAPASANVIGKLAGGIADDMLTTTLLACKCKKLISPAMNTNMYENPIVQDNLIRLKNYDYEIIEPAVGLLACKDTGKGKMPEPSVLYEYILKELYPKKDLSGKNVLVTAGATMEEIDPVRYITNHSTGKMGYAIAKACMLRGANVTLISGKTYIDKPPFVNIINVCSAEEMFNAVSEHYKEADYIFKAAAVADYTPSEKFTEKLKKNDNDMVIKLKRTKDILKFLGENKTDKQKICGFSMETENLIPNSKEKLKRKNCDMIIANSIRTEGAGFGTDTNIITIITENKSVELPKMTKEEAAHKVVDAAIKL